MSPTTAAAAAPQRGNKRELIYIMSPSYSGSTLLTMLLAQHPQIASIGELKATAMGPMDNYQCSCGEPLLQCGFWRELTSRLTARGLPFSLDRFGTHFASSNPVFNRVLGAQLRGPRFERSRRMLLRHWPGLRPRIPANPAEKLGPVGSDLPDPGGTLLSRWLKGAPSPGLFSRCRSLVGQGDSPAQGWQGPMPPRNAKNRRRASISTAPPESGVIP